MYKTITLGGTEQKVIILGQNCDIRNDGAETIYASAKPDIVAGADGVVSIPIGQAVKLLDTRGTVYLLGTGVVQLCGNDYGYLVFKCAPAGGGSGGTQDDIARNMASANAASIAALQSDVEDVQTIAENISNPNLLDNPWFGKGVINQRGKTEYSGGYAIDRWIVSSNLTLTLNDTGVELTASGGTGYFTQFVCVDNITAFNDKELTASIIMDDGTVFIATGTCPSTNDNATFAETTLPDNVTFRVFRRLEGEIPVLGYRLVIPDGVKVKPKAAKLELGSVATPFTPPDPATELAKCQRYYIGGAVDGFGVSMTANVYYVTFPLPVTMRVNPSLENVTFTVRDKLTNQVVTVLDDATPYVANVNIVRANSVTVGFNKTAHGITDVKYNAQLFGGLSADL